MTRHNFPEFVTIGLGSALLPHVDDWAGEHGFAIYPGQCLAEGSQMFQGQRPDVLMMPSLNVVHDKARYWRAQAMVKVGLTLAMVAYAVLAVLTGRRDFTIGWAVGWTAAMGLIVAVYAVQAVRKWLAYRNMRDYAANCLVDDLINTPKGE